MQTQFIPKAKIQQWIQGHSPDYVPSWCPAVACSTASTILGRPVHTGSLSLHYAEAVAAMQGTSAYEEFGHAVLDARVELIIAFQDGGVEYFELGDYVKAFADLIQKHGLTFWMNVESFERDVPPNRPPIEWRKLRYKMEQAAPYVEKLITFEFSNYMSPNSMYPSAHNLYRRYISYLET